MEKLPMCRICSVQNVRLYLVVNRNFRELYEKLTYIPFVTEDRRPILACSFCCAKLKQCCQLLRKCLKAEELLTQMMNEDYEPNPLMNQDQIEFLGGFIKSPIQNISIVDVEQTESIAIKEELPDVCEGLHDIIEPKEEHHSNEHRYAGLPLEATASTSALFRSAEHNYAGLPVEATASTSGLFRSAEHSYAKLPVGATASTFDLSRSAGVHVKNLITMEKLPMCRICLVQNVRMYLVVNRNFHELYEKLTDIPFLTEDRRPILACFFCYAKLKKCCQLMRKCLEAEKLFAHMMNKDYEPNPFINQDHLEYLGGFIKSPVENISIVDVVQTESIAIKEELPAVCEGLDDMIEPKEEHQSDGATVAKNTKLDTGRTKLGDATATATAEKSKNDKPDSKVIRTTQKRTSKPGTHFKDKCDQSRKNNTTIKQSNNQQCNRVKKNTQNTGTQIGEKTYKCDICPRSYRDKRCLTKHIRLHTGEKLYKCGICQRSFRYNINLTEHIRIHSNEKPYKCDVCHHSFSDKFWLTKHIRIHTSEKLYNCDVCQRSFSQKSNLTQHIRVHTGEKPYKCDVCQRSFSVKNTLTNHTRIHTGEKPYKCDVCLHSFSAKADLRRHNHIHTGEKPYKCDVCQRSFSHKVNLTQHIRIHTGEKPYKCDVCHSSFSHKSNLTKHTRRHTGEKPYKCGVCLLSFLEKYDLTKHTVVHTGEKPFKCDLCQRSFSLKNNLTKHTRIHTGEKQFKCDTCERSFRHFCNLKRHILKIHNGKKLHVVDSNNIFV